jgi:hypothetical protein
MGLNKVAKSILDLAIVLCQLDSQRDSDRPYIRTPRRKEGKNMVKEGRKGHYEGRKKGN